MPLPYQYRGWSRLSRHYVPAKSGLTLANTFEGGTSGVAPTVATSGGASGNEFTQVFTSAGGTITWDNTEEAHGFLSCNVTTAASASAFATWAFRSGSYQQIWFREYLYFTAFPANAVLVFYAQGGGGLKCSAVAVNTNGTLSVQNAAGGGIAGTTTTTLIPLNQWFRIEGYVIGDPAAGQVELKLFTPADSVVPVETKTSAATQNTRSPIDTARLGITSNVASVGPFWMDDIGVSSTGYMGPTVFTGPPVYPLHRPVRAQIPPTFAWRGTVTHAAGAYGQAGPAVRALRCPVRSPVPPPPPARGRTTGRSAAPDGLGAPLRPLTGPVRARIPQPPRGGRCSGRAGTFTAAVPQAGPPVYPPGHPVQSRQSPCRGGRTAGRAGTLTAGVPQAGPPVYPPGHPVAARRGQPPPARGRTNSRRGPYGQTGSPVVRLRRPVCGQPQRPVLTGRTSSRAGTFTFVAPPLFTVGALSAATAPAGLLTAKTAASAESIYGLTYTPLYLPGSGPVPGMTASTNPATVITAVTVAATPGGTTGAALYGSLYAAVYQSAVVAGALRASDTRTGGPA